MSKADELRRIDEAMMRAESGQEIRILQEMRSEVERELDISAAACAERAVAAAKDAHARAIDWRSAACAPENPYRSLNYGGYSAEQMMKWQEELMAHISGQHEGGLAGGVPPKVLESTPSSSPGYFWEAVQKEVARQGAAAAKAAGQVGPGRFMEVQDSKDALVPKDPSKPMQVGDYEYYVVRYDSGVREGHTYTIRSAPQAKTPPVPVGDDRCVATSSLGRCSFSPDHGGDHYAWTDKGYGLMFYSWRDGIGKGAAVAPKPDDGLCSKENHGIRCVHDKGHGGYCHTPLGKGFGGPVPQRSMDSRVVAFGIALELPSPSAVRLGRANRRLASDLTEARERGCTARAPSDGWGEAAPLDQRIKESQKARAKR